MDVENRDFALFIIKLNCLISQISDSKVWSFRGSKLWTLLNMSVHLVSGKSTLLNLIFDNVCMYEEMMTNDDNVESSLLTSSFIENT